MSHWLTPTEFKGERMECEFDDQRPLSRSGVAAGFLMLFSECLFCWGLVILLFDHKAWTLIPMIVGGLLTWGCFRHMFTPAAYKEIVAKVE